MLHIKDSKNIFEFKDYFKSPTMAFSNNVEVLNGYSIRSITSNIFNFKSKGCSPVLLRRMLIFMLFPGDRNIDNLFSTYYQLFYEGKKDRLYDILRSEKINWQDLL